MNNDERKSQLLVNIGKLVEEFEGLNDNKPIAVYVDFRDDPGRCWDWNGEKFTRVKLN